MSFEFPRDWVFAAICLHSARIPDLEEQASRERSLNTGGGADDADASGSDTPGQQSD